MIRDDSAQLLTTLQRLLSDLSERAIHLDPMTAEEFSSLAGQEIEIHCRTLSNMAPDLAREQHRSECGPSENPNVAVTGKPLGLLQKLITGATAEVVVIDGDATVLMALQTLVKEYSPDLVKPLDAWLGRETGQRTGALVELAMGTLGELLASTRVQAQQATEAYFTDRYTTREQSESLAGRLDRLRLHVDRLEAIVNGHWQQDIPD